MKFRLVITEVSRGPDVRDCYTQTTTTVKARLIGASGASANVAGDMTLKFLGNYYEHFREFAKDWLGRESAPFYIPIRGPILTHPDTATDQLQEELARLKRELSHRDELDCFSAPLSCPTHGLVPNLALFGNKCPACERDRLREALETAARRFDYIAASASRNIADPAVGAKEAREAVSGARESPTYRHHCLLCGTSHRFGSECHPKDGEK